LLRRLGEEGEKPVTELLKPFRMSQPAVSKHLRCLRNAGLVRTRTEGRQRFYRLEAKRLREVHTWISFFERYWDAKLDALGEYLEKAPKTRTA
jgi:DNA-binding transcriptional ArsR family regulator